MSKHPRRAALAGATPVFSWFSWLVSSGSHASVGMGIARGRLDHIKKAPNERLQPFPRVWRGDLLRSGASKTNIRIRCPGDLTRHGVVLVLRHMLSSLDRVGYCPGVNGI